MKTISIWFLTILIVVATYSCDKEKMNNSPTIKFIQPDSNLIITHDTILTFVVEPMDIDGEIVKVEFLINGTIVHSINNAPYKFDWYDAKLDNVGIFIIEAKAYDNKGGIGIASIQIEISDYRIKYLGSFYFTTITEHWMLGQPNTYDTSFYNGEIHKYISTDSGDDLYLGDDSNENPDEKITIEFKQKTKITTILKTNGEFTDKYGYHYGHRGKYTHVDSILFEVGGLGGLGAGWNYKVIGIRK